MDVTETVHSLYDVTYLHRGKSNMNWNPMGMLIPVVNHPATKLHNGFNYWFQGCVYVF